MVGSFKQRRASGIRSRAADGPRRSGQGGALGPLTAAGVADVAPDDAGAASGVVNVAQQLGGSLGLGVLVTLFAAAGSGALDGRDLLAHRISASLTAGAALLVLALAATLIVGPGAAVAIRGDGALAEAAPAASR